MDKLFQRSDLPSDIPLTDSGLRPERPFQILGLLETLSLGDFILNVVFLSTLANQFDHARLHVKFRDFRPYAKDVMALSPWITIAEPISDNRSFLLKSLAPKAPSYMQIGTQKGKHVPLYDMIVTSHMAQSELVHALPDPVVLRLPRDRESELRNKLIACGLKPAQWFAVLHYRESTYQYPTPGSHRDSDPAAFDDLVDEIIAAGGQAVRIGHQGMAPFRARPGFVDLSAEPFLVQAAAASFARFMIVGPSGAVALALAFQVPSTLVDAIRIFGTWGPIDVLTHVVETPSGQQLRNASLRASGLMDINTHSKRLTSEPRLRVKKATASDLRTVAHKLLMRTMECPAWRVPAQSPVTMKTNHFVWPPRRTDDMAWVDL